MTQAVATQTTDTGWGSTSPTDGGKSLILYRGFSAYGEQYSMYEITYDAAIWQLSVAMESGESQTEELVNRNQPQCSLMLGQGAIQSTPVTTIRLADREWGINLTQQNILLYILPSGRIAYIFGVHLPEDFRATEKSMCQQQAEAVIDTFSIVDK